MIEGIKNRSEYLGGINFFSSVQHLKRVESSREVNSSKTTAQVTREWFIQNNVEAVLCTS